MKKILFSLALLASVLFGVGGEAAYTPNTASGRSIDVRNCGAVPDAKKIVDIVTTNGSTTATAASNPFTSANISGKRVNIYKYSDGTYPFQGTATYVSAGQVTLSSNAAQTCASGSCMMVWGTDNASAINTCLDQAAAAVNQTVSDPNAPKGAGVMRVLFPIDTRGDAYLFSSTLTPDCCNILIDADAALISDVGTAGINNRTWAISGVHSTSIDRLTLFAMGGMGIDIGSSSASVNAASNISFLQIWHAGTNYNGGLSPTSQIGLRLRGYDYFINKYWVKGGNIGLHLNEASDVFADQLELIGSATGMQLTSAENVAAPNVTCDTGSNICLAIDGSRTANLSARAFSVVATTLTNGLQIGEYDTSNINRGLTINYSAIRTGGTCAKVSYTEDSTITLNCSNAALYSASGGNITTGITYGSGNVGSLLVKANFDGNIATKRSGTVVGRLESHVDGTETINP